MPLWLFFFVILTLSIDTHCSPPPSLPLRMRRYADAIFTNSYRKVLSQLSARKLLQDIMSRQQGERERNQEQGERVRLGRQVNSMWADQKQTALESILVALLQKRRKEQVGAALKPQGLGSKTIDSKKDALLGLSVGIPEDEDGL